MKYPVEASSLMVAKHPDIYHVSLKCFTTAVSGPRPLHSSRKPCEGLKIFFRTPLK